MAEYRNTFKYLRYCENSLKALTEGTIKFSSPLEFNDPFDCHPKFVISSARQFRKGAKEYWRRFRKEHGLRKGDLKRNPSVSDQLSAVRAKMGTGEFREEILRDYGIVSMSLDPTHQLMWSHYADHHKGFVIEFRSPLVSETPVSEERIWGLLCGLEVDYQEERPVVRYPEAMDNLDELIRVLFLVKSSMWSYEEEIRCIDSKRGPGIRPYERNEILKSVILGARMKEDHKRRIENIVDRLRPNIPDLYVYQATLHPDKYEVLIPGHPMFG